jgi:hypothetical protein
MSTPIQTESLTPLHWGAVALAAITGVIHFVLGVRFISAFGPRLQPILFVLAGLGFFGAIALFLVDYRRRQLYIAGVGFTALQIVLWLWLNQRVQPALSPIEIIDKTAQVLLIAALLVLFQGGE